ncbi:hypothetical protein [Pedobacter sp. GR22-6]|uniref:hypothetical protein n=1 Tax=Pedobacter sp. GR22-6 TaxID=3127957 RepID=UPI00307D2EEB
MKKTMKMVVMAALCLNFCYGQAQKDCPTEKKKGAKSIKEAHTSANTQVFKYAFTGYKSGYKTGYRISNDEFLKGKSITVRNYKLKDLYALALRLEPPHDSSEREAVQDRIILDLRQPEKLEKLYCYKLAVPYQQQDNFWVIMQRSLSEEFPEYTAVMERRGKEYFMVIRDKEY